MKQETWYYYKFGSVLRFGKYKGRTIREVASSDPSYLDWCCRVVNTFLIAYHDLEKIIAKSLFRPSQEALRALAEKQDIVDLVVLRMPWPPDHESYVKVRRQIIKHSFCSDPSTVRGWSKVPVCSLSPVKIIKAKKAKTLKFPRQFINLCEKRQREGETIGHLFSKVPILTFSDFGTEPLNQVAVSLLALPLGEKHFIRRWAREQAVADGRAITGDPFLFSKRQFFVNHSNWRLPTAEGWYWYLNQTKDKTPAKEDIVFWSKNIYNEEKAFVCFFFVDLTRSSLFEVNAESRLAAYEKPGKTFWERILSPHPKVIDFLNAPQERDPLSFGLSFTIKSDAGAKFYYSSLGLSFADDYLEEKLMGTSWGNNRLDDDCGSRYYGADGENNLIDDAFDGDASAYWESQCQ